MQIVFCIQEILQLELGGINCQVMVQITYTAQALATYQEHDSNYCIANIAVIKRMIVLVVINLHQFLDDIANSAQVTA